MRFDDEPVRPGIGTTCRPSSAPKRDTLIRDQIRGLHQGQRPRVAQTGRTHGSTRPVVVYVELPLRRRGRPQITDVTVAERVGLELALAWCGDVELAQSGDAMPLKTAVQ